MNISPLKPQVVASDIAPERLAHNPDLTEKQKVAEASRQFEVILLKQILESSQKTVIKSKYSNDDSTASGIYHDMITTQLADSISKTGKFGLAKVFEQQLDRPEAVAKSSNGSSPASVHGHGHEAHAVSPNNHLKVHSLKPLHERTLTQSH
ncbi:MAG TPA: rod-binding protein [Candidatus Angelobacter sp.]|nr:rod-binding protein [Candidatus Angelobacter sp.]